MTPNLSNKRMNRLNHISPAPRRDNYFFARENNYSQNPEPDFDEGEVIADLFQKDENKSLVDKSNVNEDLEIISSDSLYLSLTQTIKNPQEESFFTKNSRTLFVKPFLEDGKYSAAKNIINITERQPSNSEMNIEDVEETDFVEKFIS